MRKDGATAADYETWERDHQMKYQLLLGCIVNTILSAEAQILRTSGLQLDVIYAALRLLTPRQLSGPLLLPIVTIVCGPYVGQDPSTLQERGRQSSTLVRTALSELKAKGDYKELDVFGLFYKGAPCQV